MEVEKSPCVPAEAASSERVHLLDHLLGAWGGVIIKSNNATFFEDHGLQHLFQGQVLLTPPPYHSHHLFDTEHPPTDLLRQNRDAVASSLNFSKS